MDNLKKINGYYVDKKKIGQRIFNIRNSRNDTLEEFGKIFEAEKSNVLKWENGSSVPNRSRIEKIAKKGNITVNELLYGSVEEFITNNMAEILKKYSTEESAERYINNNDNRKKEWIVFYVHRLESIYNINSVDNIENILMCISKILDVQDEYNYKTNTTDYKVYKGYYEKEITARRLLSIYRDTGNFEVIDTVFDVLKNNIPELQGYHKDVALKEIENLSVFLENIDDN